MAVCDAYVGFVYPAAHTCDDPLACVLKSARLGPDEREQELERLHVLLDRIEDLTHGRKTLRSDDVLGMIHEERGGPR